MPYQYEKMKNLYLSTTAPDAAVMARAYGLGIEIAEYCTAWNMDEQFETVHPQVLKQIEAIPYRIFHAPFNELFPCAIDPQARELAASRYRQAISLAKQYGAEKIVIHGGYNPYLYYPVWYVAESVKFWKGFIKSETDITIVLENVLEEKPEMLLEIVQAVNAPNLCLCLDVGHVNAYSKINVMQWLRACAPWLSHFYIHNNDGTCDSHSALNCGSIPMLEFLVQAQTLCPDATFTLELLQAEPSVVWLAENGLI